jgi:single-stranded-DNA-specific exonuclease
MFESIPRRERLLSIVLTHPQWHQGVIGIVASRLVEVFHRPTILIGAGDPVWRGSGRSIPGFNLYEGLKACADYLDGFGGHAQAAGLQIRPDRIADFAKAFDQHARSVLKPEDLVPQQRIDAWCDIESVNERLVRELAALVPFGFGNPEPVFAARDVRVVNKQVVGGDHLKLRVPWGKVVMAVIAYGQAGLFDQIGGRIDLAYTPEFSYFGGAEHIQLRAKDIIVPDR